MSTFQVFLLKWVTAHVLFQSPLFTLTPTPSYCCTNNTENTGPTISYFRSAVTQSATIGATIG